MHKSSTVIAQGTTIVRKRSFPRLEELTLRRGSLLAGPRDLVFPRLRKLEPLGLGLGERSLEEICKACPLLEELRFVACDFRSRRVYLESPSLVKLWVFPRERVEELVIRMTNLETLWLFKLGQVGFELPKLKTLCLDLNRCFFSHLGRVELMKAEEETAMEIMPMLILISQANTNRTVKCLRVVTTFRDLSRAVSLSSVLPRTVEVLYVDSNLVEVMEISEIFQGRNAQGVLGKLDEHREHQLPDFFSLRKGVIILAKERMKRIGFKFGSMMLELVRCSPRMERLLVRCDWLRGSHLELDVLLFDLRARVERLVVVWEGERTFQALMFEAECERGDYM